MKPKEVNLEGWIRELDEYLHTYEGNKEDFRNGVMWFAGRDDNPIVKRALEQMLINEEKALSNEEPFTAKWFKNDIDYKHRDFIDSFVEIVIKEDCHGHCTIEIINGEMYWTLINSSSQDEWYCTLWDEPNNDAWIPSVKTIGDFKRLFRVATGFDLPLKNKWL